MFNSGLRPVATRPTTQVPTVQHPASAIASRIIYLKLQWRTVNAMKRIHEPRGEHDLRNLSIYLYRLMNTMAAVLAFWSNPKSLVHI